MELKQEDWEIQDTFNELDIDEILEDGGDLDEDTDNFAGEVE